MYPKQLLVSMLGLSFLFAAVAQADLINEVVQQDTGLAARGDLQNNNSNASDRIIVGGTSTNNDYEVPILRWTLPTVPVDHVAITDGTITLTVYPHSSSSAATGKTVNVYLIKPSNAGWLESEATWNEKAPSTAWVGGGGLGNPGDGYDASPVDSFVYADTSTVTLTIPQAVINDWIANPSNNAGIIMFMEDLDSTERFLRFWSNNGSVPATLSFETQLVPEPGSLALLALGGVVMLRRRNRA